MASAVATSQFRSEIVAANQKFMGAFARGDAQSVAGCYTAEAWLLPPGSDVVQGTAAIATFWRGAMDAGITSVTLDTVEVEGREDTAGEVGRFTLSGRDGVTLDRGKYVVIWRRDGGAWKLHRDIWNTSQAAPA
jgi:ketosteroid isomerase-like protein